MSTYVPSLLALQTTKADDSTVVHNTGDETIAGTKTFSSTIQGNISGTAAGGAAPLSITNAMLAGSIAASKLIQTDIVLAESQITNLTTDLASKLNLSGGTMTGNLILNADPTSSSQAATKNYVDMIAAGFNQFVVAAASTASLTGTYNNGVAGVGATFTLTATGAFSLDGQAGILNAQYLLKDQSSSFQNGIYTLTTVGNGSTQAVLTRSIDYDTPSQITAGDIVNVANGTINAGISYLQTATVTTVGTDPITFSRWGGQSMTFVGNVTGSGFSPVTLTIGAGQVVNSMIADSTIDLTAKVTGILPNGNTTATSANTASSIVARDSSGNFTAGTITASLTGNSSTATALQNARAIYGNNFDGTAALTQIIASTFGGTGNGFTKFSGATTSEKTYTLPDATCTILTTNAAVTEVQGGTNQTTYATGDTLYASASNTLSKLSGNTTTSKQYLSQTGTGTVSQAPAWTSIAGSDITGAALTAGNDTNVTLTLGGTPSTSLLRAASITVGWTGTLGAARGGTNVDSSAWAQGDLVYISATGTWNHLPKNTTATRYLANTGTSNNPAWDQINLANGVTGTLANSNTTATSNNTASTIVSRDSNGAFSMGALNCYDSGVSTNGTSAVILVNGAGSTTNAGATANFSSGNSSTAGNIYGISVEKFGTEVLYMGVNKNTTTGSVPANTCFISTYQSAGKLAIGRGGSNNLPSSVDILLSGAGSVVLGAGAVATNATDGFLYITTCAGTPTGAPTANTGRVAMVYDTTANKIWFYNGSWRGVAVT